jgi:hypothetical protein
LLIEEALANGHAIDLLLEGIGHAAADDDLIGLLEQVVDQRNFVRDFRPPENGEQRAFGIIEYFVKSDQLLLHQKTGRLVGQRDADHGRVGAVSGTEGIVHEHVTHFGETGAESFNRGRFGFAGRIVFVLGLTFFLDVEA